MIKGNHFLCNFSVGFCECFSCILQRLLYGITNNVLFDGFWKVKAEHEELEKETGIFLFSSK